MKTIITSTENKVDALFDKRFGRAAWFCLSSVELKGKVDRGDDMFILDARGSDEYEQMRLGIGEALIPIRKTSSTPS